MYTHLIVDPVEESGYGGKKSWFESLHVLNEQLDISLEEPHLGSTHEHHCLARTKFRSVHCHAQHNTAYCIYQIARMRKLLASFWRSDDTIMLHALLIACYVRSQTKTLILATIHENNCQISLDGFGETDIWRGSFLFRIDKGQPLYHILCCF